MWRKCCDVLFWIGVSLYFGGMVTLAVSAPAVFQTARLHHMSMPGIVAPPLSMGDEVGGEIFGEMLSRFRWVEALAIALMFSGLAAWILGHRHVRRSTWILFLLWVMLVGLAGVDHIWIRPRVWAARNQVIQEAAAHVGQPADAPWPARQSFLRLHDWSEAFGRGKVYVLLAVIIGAAWRGLTDKRNTSSDKGDVMRRVMGNKSPP